MTQFEFKNDDPKKRTDTNFKNLLLVFAVIFIIFASQGQFILAIGMGIIAITFHAFKINKRDRIFITTIVFNGPHCSIEYLDENTPKEISGELKSFSCKKKFAITRSRVPYLAIYKDHSIRIRQFVTGEWTEEKMNEIISNFESAPVK